MTLIYLYALGAACTALGLEVRRIRAGVRKPEPWTYLFSCSALWPVTLLAFALSAAERWRADRELDKLRREWPDNPAYKREQHARSKR